MCIQRDWCSAAMLSLEVAYRGLYAYATSDCTLPLARSHIHSLSLAVFSRE